MCNVLFLQWCIAWLCLGDLVLNIRAAKVSILLTEKYYFHIWWIANDILFYKLEPTICWLWTVLDDLSTFEYIEIIMMFWSMDMICGVWMNGVNVCYGWEFWKLWLQWNMNMILEWVKLCKLFKKWHVELFMFL
jgi:hypothetical protein